MRNILVTLLQTSPPPLSKNNYVYNISFISIGQARINMHIFVSVYANYISPSVMTDANKVGPVRDPLYVVIKLLKMTDVS